MKKAENNIPFGLMWRTAFADLSNRNFKSPLADGVGSNNSGSTLVDLDKQFLVVLLSYLKTIGETLFGNKKIMLPTIELISKREGIGRYLEEGAYSFVERYDVDTWRSRHMQVVPVCTSLKKPGSMNLSVQN